MRVIGRIITYKSKKVKVTEKATGFVKDPDVYWVRALEPVDGYEIGEEFTVSKGHVHEQIRNKAKV